MSRADRLADRLAGPGLDAILVTGLANLRYLTGFTGDNGLALVGPEVRVFATDFRFVEQAAAQVDGFDRVRLPQEDLEAVSNALPAGAVRLGFDDAHLTVKRHAKLRALLPDRVELVPAGGLVEEARRVKDADEVARIRAAAELADDAYGRLVERGLVGRTERAVALALEVDMRELGARAPSFPSIVAAGAHGALPHAEPRDVVIPRDTLVVVDWGAELDGYCSDCTRTLATGSLDAEARHVYALVLRAQAAALAAVAPGPPGREVDAVARKIIEDAGRGEQFGHGLGHGVGLEVHEGPTLSRRGEDPLEAGNVVTVEPGVYVPGRLGVRIEDLVVVEPDGAQVLSGVPKTRTEVG